MSGRGPTLTELLASNPAAAEMLNAHCPAATTASSAKLRCALRNGHEGSHYDAFLQIAWTSNHHPTAWKNVPRLTET